MRTVNATLLTQLAAEGYTAFKLIDLEIDAYHYRHTDCDVPIIYDSNRFEPLDLRINQIQYSANWVVNQMQMELANQEQTLHDAFVDGNPQDSPVMVWIAVTDSKGTILDSGNAVGLLFDGEIDDWDLDEMRINITVSGMMSKWAQETLSRHPASCRWKKFKGTECGYSGSETECDRSYARCQTLSNTDAFGGFRWLPSIVGKEFWWGRSAGYEE